MPCRRTPRAAVAFEHLEHRRVLATVFQDGVWTIRGDRDAARPDDVIVVESNPANPAQLRATVNGAVVGTRAAARVAVISVFGGRGDDTITVTLPAGSPIRTVLRGGHGDDTITGGDGRDDLRGGPGRDQLRGGGGDDELLGGLDDDTLAGGRGNDVLRGQQGEDTLRGGPGRNSLFGGIDHDTFYGVAGMDEARLAVDEHLIGNESTNPLREVSGSEALRSWYIDTAMKRWGPHLGGSAGWPELRALASAGGLGSPLGLAADASAGGQAPADTGDFSGTNNQVAGVDEADLVKTDGEHLYVLAGDGVDIVRAWPAEELAVVSHLAIEGREQSLFLHGTTLTVLSQDDGWVTTADGLSAAWWGGSWQPKVAVTVIDVADPSAPVVRERTEIDGWLVSARAIDARVIVVTQAAVDVPMPAIVGGRDADAVPESQIRIALASSALVAAPWSGSATYEDEAAYRARLEAAWDAGALPGYTVSAGDHADGGLLADAGLAYVPVTPQDTEFLSVVSFVVGDGHVGPESVTSVGGTSGVVYASTSSLYVATTTWGAWWDATDETTISTNVYAFDLTDDAIPLVAMGAVDGMVLDQFSLDEHGGHLRVATTTWSTGDFFRDGSTSGVTVLRQHDGNLQLVGAVTGLAPGERIYSARFAGDQAYVSTFRQIDPFFVLDLADPAAPRVTGELKIPGFSSYLQRLGESHVLGVGRDVDPESGRVLGIQLSLFDVSDATDPRRVATHTFPGEGWGSWSEALWNHHAISWFPEQGVLALPLEQGGWDAEASSGLVVLRVDLGAAPGFSVLGEISHADPVRRSIRIGEFLYSVSGGEVQVHRVADPADARGRTALSAAPEAPDAGVVF